MDPKSVLLGLREKSVGLSKAQTRISWREIISDVAVLDSRGDRAAVFEVKYAKSPEKMEACCEEALRQIDRRKYAEDFADTCSQVFCYGIAFYKKRCLVRRK